MPGPKEHPPVVSPKSAFVDESGDPNRLAKSSLFFTLGAVLINDADLPRAYELLDAIRRVTGRQAGHRLHFNSMKPAHREAAVATLSQAEFITIIGVLVNKSALKADGLDERNRMYRYSLRLMQERISWHGASDSRVTTHVAHMVGMQTNALGAYFDHLRRQRTRTNWRGLATTAPHITNENSQPLLQLADIAVSAIAQAFKTTSDSTPAFLATLTPRLSRGPAGAKLSTYGLKVLPSNAATHERFPWLSTL